MVKYMIVAKEIVVNVDTGFTVRAPHSHILTRPGQEIKQEVQSLLSKWSVAALDTKMWAKAEWPRLGQV